MNVGKGEAAQIIHMFGRGVRRKGYSISLKRRGKRERTCGTASAGAILAASTTYVN